jgi:hypothetical protein
VSAKINDGGSAFPILPPICGDGHPPAGYPYPDPGMTLRDWFAGQALAGLVFHNHYGARSDDEIANGAYAYADAMIAAREAKP